ncbi:MAG: hypothetical protein KI786_00060, partial [Mameliella sp.]|nr:hypothetical protein [Phaeodactylibacter sp.]
ITNFCYSVLSRGDIVKWPLLVRVGRTFHPANLEKTGKFIEDRILNRKSEHPIHDTVFVITELESPAAFSILGARIGR